MHKNFKNRLGSVYTTNEGQKVKVIEYMDCHNVTIKFEDGVIMTKVNLNNLKNGKVKKPVFRIGEIHITNEGYSTVILDYVNVKNCTIKFDDGTIYKNINYTDLKNGSIRKNKCRLGRTYMSNKGYPAKIIEYIDSYNCTLEFEDGFLIKNIAYGAIKRGSFINPNYPSVHGVGYIGVGVHKTSINGKHTPAYSIWCGILVRCYGKNKEVRYPTYKECTIFEDWKCFQVFAKWFYTYYKEGFHLDKDVLVRGNKIYSPDTCCFIPCEINGVIKVSNKITKYVQGVRKMGNNYQAEFTKGGVYTYIGMFNTIEEASIAYTNAKEEWIKELADIWKNEILDKTYKALYKYKI